MQKILGLDIGTNSIGSAVVELGNSDGRILHLGTRFIPAGGEQYNNFIQGKPLTNAKGQTVSECAKRRQFRSQRRNIDRYKKRRDNLILVFDALGIKPVGIKYEISCTNKYPVVAVLPHEKIKGNKVKRLYDIENTELYKVYELRNRGINGKLSLNKLGRVLYSLNIKRGYQDIGLLNVEDEEEKDLKRLKENQWITKLKITNAVFTNTYKNKKPVYEFTAVENELDQVIGTTSVPYFDKYIGKELKFLLEKNKENNIDLKLYRESEWKQSREQNNASLGSITIGEKIFSEMEGIKNNPSLRHWKDLNIKNRVYDRKYYKAEFERIWEAQALYHDILNNTPPDILNQIAAILKPGNPEKQKTLAEKGLKYIIKEYIIYYQRILKKGQKDLIARCMFEKDEKKVNADGKPFTIIHRGIPKSHPLFQEFRIWQTINNIVIKNSKADVLSLDSNQYEKIYELLNSKDEIEPSDILKKLSLSKEEYYLNYKDGFKITGNKTYAAIKKAFGKAEKNKLEELTTDNKLYERLWHVLYSIPVTDKNSKIKILTSDKFSISEEVAKKLAIIKFEQKYGGLSALAISKLLPLMKRGKYFDEENILPAVKEKLIYLLTNDNPDKLNSRLKDKLLSFLSVKDFQGLRYDEAAELVYTKHTKDAITSQYDKPSDIKFIKQHSLRHPVVEKIINECLKTVKAVWEEPSLGKPDKIAVEMARELQKSQQQRAKIQEMQKGNKDKNDEAREALRSDKFNISNPTVGQVEKYRLWVEQNYRCPYTGDYISPEDLFATRSNGDYKYDVDHIIPRTRLKDDSFNNKILCRRDANLAKGNTLSRVFMESKRNMDGLLSFDDYCSWAKSLPFKRDRLLMKDEDVPDDFVRRQLNETQYITKRVIDELSKIVGSENIIFTSGGITSVLRHEWGVDDIFKKELLERYKRWEEKLQTAGVNKTIIRYENNRVEINDYSKRIDLRNHAIDALVVACTAPKHVKYFNDLNKIYQDNNNPKYKELKDFVTEAVQKNGRTKIRLKKPWPLFCDDAADKIKQIIVSVKNDKTYITETAVKGLLHDQNPLGWRFVPGEPIPVDKFISGIKRLKTKESIDEYLNEHLPVALRLRIKSRLAEVGYDVKTFAKALKDNPLTGKDCSIIDKITIMSRKVVSHVSLLNLKDKDIKDNLVVDKTILEELKLHISKFKNLAEALLPDNIDMFNLEREERGLFPVYKVLTMEKDEYDINDPSANSRIIERKNSFNNRAVFALKDKAYSILYEGLDEEGNKKRCFSTITLYDYVTYLKEGMSFIEKMPGFNKYVLFDSYNLMYVPEPGEIINEETFLNRKRMFNNLYYFKRLSGNQWYFLPHYVNKPLIDSFDMNGKVINVREFGLSTEDFERDLNYNLVIKEYGIPVIVDQLGNIKPKVWQYFE